MSESLKGPRDLEIVLGPGDDSRGPEDLQGVRQFQIIRFVK